MARFAMKRYIFRMGNSLHHDDAACQTPVGEDTPEKNIVFSKMVYLSKQLLAFTLLDSG